MDDLTDGHDEVPSRADHRRKLPVAWDRRNPAQKLRVVIGIEVPEFELGRDSILDVREMGMEKSGLMPVG